MRTPLRRILLLLVILLPLLVTCKKECPQSTPCREPDPTAKGLTLAATPTGSTRVNVTMIIEGMAILNTTADNAPLDVLIPDIGGSHEPFLYALEQHKMTSPSGRKIDKETPKSDTYDVMILKDDALALGAPPIEASLAYTIQGGECPAMYTNKNSLRWAPSLTEVLRQPKLVAFKANMKLHARMRIEKGLLVSVPADVYRWEFRSPPRGQAHTQMLTGAVVHQFTVDLPAGNEVLIIKSTPLGSGTTVDLAALTAVNGQITFTIGITPPNHRLPGTAPFMSVDHHFPHYFQLLDLSSIVDNGGKPLTAAPATKPHRRGPPHCFTPSTTLVNCGPIRP